MVNIMQVIFRKEHEKNNIPYGIKQSELKPRMKSVVQMSTSRQYIYVFMRKTLIFFKRNSDDQVFKRR